MNRGNFNKATSLGVGGLSKGFTVAGAETEADARNEDYRDYPLPEGDEEVIRRRAKMERAKDPRPNILWVFTDQQQWDALSCMGNAHVYTPNMDTLARKGVRFEKAYCPSPWCGPSRGCMVTGYMPHRTGVRHNGDTLSTEVPTIGEVLREAGYQTWWSGKWHLPEARVTDRNEMRGFHNIRLPAGLPKQVLGDSNDMLFAGNAHDLLCWHASLFPNPWFYGVSLHNPHDICLWPKTDKKWWIGMQQEHYEPVENLPPMPENFAIPRNEPEAARLSRHRVQENWTETDWRAYRADYYNMVGTVDRAVGMVLEGLRKGGWEDNTVVIFTSDHGEGAGAHQWWEKRSSYEESARIPMIVVPPGGLAEGRVDRESLVSGLDIAATVYDYADIRDNSTHGLSLRPAVEKNKRVPRDYVVMHNSPGSRRNPEERKVDGRMIRSSRYKYICFNWGENPEQFFDLEQDPGELNNLIDDPHLKGLIEEHRSMLENWKRETGDPYPKTN